MTTKQTKSWTERLYRAQRIMELRCAALRRLERELETSGSFIEDAKYLQRHKDRVEDAKEALFRLTVERAIEIEHGFTGMQVALRNASARDAGPAFDNYCTAVMGCQNHANCKWAGYV